MIFNFTDKFQFTTRLKLNEENMRVIKCKKLLGTIIQDDLKWDQNTARLVKKANKRMILLRKLAEFNAPIKDLIHIYILYIRSILEQSCVVWNSSLSEKNIQDLERVQKCAVKIITKRNKMSYKKILLKLDLQDLQDRRNYLCENFAIKSLKNGSMNDLFTKNTKNHNMNTRHSEKFHICHSNTERLKKSAIPQMQRTLNQIL